MTRLIPMHAAPLVGGFVLGLLLAACAPEPEFGQCEPGVEEMSNVATVVPPCP